jgi:peptidoglycan/xylan/chitin deacetylase (PgdA/CDA1 family)
MLASFAVATLACACACSSSGSNTGGSVNATSGSSGVPAAGADGTAAGTAGNGGATTAMGGAATGGGGTAGNGASGTANAGGVGNPSGGTGGQTAAGGGNAAGGSTGGSTGGGSAQGGAGAGGSVGSSEPSGMPVPMTNNVPKPSGTPGNLTVLDWAGFKAAVSFTFDDALSSQISNYAALQGTGVKLTFFLVSNNNGTSPTWTQAQKDGHELGNHTAHHCHDDGTGCAWGTYAGSLGSELDQCTMHVTQTFGASDVWTTASPYGDTGYASPASTRFLLNRGVGGGQVGANDNTSPYALPCHVAAEGEVASAFNSATDSARSAGKWQIFLIHSLGGDGGYNPLSVTDVVAAINHAKTAGDTWADSMVHVGAYWRAQKLLAAVTPSTSGTSKTWSWTLPAHFPSGRYLRVKVGGGTLSQGGAALAWSSHGYYEVALDAGSVTLSP